MVEDSCSSPQLCSVGEFTLSTGLNNAKIPNRKGRGDPFGSSKAEAGGSVL